MCWNPKYIILIIASTVITWLSGLGLERLQMNSHLLWKSLMTVCLVCNMGILAFFKYLDFILDNMNVVLGNLACCAS